uniref:Uncharacterized protein n=1 Tax=Cucumis melo TaxID=3656 RepID=A0A9I9E981_CUCME
GRQKAKPIRSPRIYHGNETTTDRESRLKAGRPLTKGEADTDPIDDLLGSTKRMKLPRTGKAHSRPIGLSF